MMQNNGFLVTGTTLEESFYNSIRVIVASKVQVIKLLINISISCLKINPCLYIRLKSISYRNNHNLKERFLAMTFYSVA